MYTLYVITARDDPFSSRRVTCDAIVRLHLSREGRVIGLKRFDFVNIFNVAEPSITALQCVVVCPRSTLYGSMYDGHD